MTFETTGAKRRSENRKIKGGLLLTIEQKKIMRRKIHERKRRYTLT